MTTHPRMKGETNAERGLRLAQFQFEQMMSSNPSRPAQRAAHRPGSVKNAGRVSNRKGANGRVPWFKRVKGWKG